MAKKRKKVKLKQNNESDVYVKINPLDALEAKKDSLEITASLIKLQMLNHNLRDIGKKEVTQGNNAKRTLKSMSAVLGKLISEMPKIKAPRIHKKHHETQEGMQVIQKIPNKAQSSKNKIKHKLTLNDELMAIKQKLEGLN